jgi:ribosome-associated protein
MADAALDLAHTIVDTLDEKKGEEIVLLDLVGVCSFTDYFVICTGVSERTIKALAEDVALKVRERHGVTARAVEGKAASGWVLLDYGDVIAHLFAQEQREYYRLEDLWREGHVLVHMR